MDKSPSNPAHLTEEDLAIFNEVHEFNPVLIKRPEPETAEELESKGWREWLMRLMPFRFEDEFSDDHIAFWTLAWSVLLRIRKQKELFKAGLLTGTDEEIKAVLVEHECWIEAREVAILLILGRGLAKSSSLEAFAAMRGCILGSGYVLEICESQDQAEEHVGNIRELIEHDESRVLEYYPHMEVDPNAKVNGKKTKDRTDLFITIGGFIVRAKGLNANVRGLRIGGLRPDLIILDDVDGVNDSLAVSLKKYKQITSSIIPTQARRWSIICFGQNLILETGVMNLIHTRKKDALAERTTIGVSNTFKQFREGIEYKTFLDPEDGGVKHIILPAAERTWAGVNIQQAQKFLYDSGLETFLAEYMNNFEHLKSDKVYHEYNEARHVISWSMFEAKFGVRYIPGNWKAKASGDLGYSLKSESCWFFGACAPQNTPVPGRYFGYRSVTFTRKSIDDQAIDLWEELFPDPETGKPHFEALQRFKDYPELFRMLDQRPRCSELLKRFKYDALEDKFIEPPFDPLTAGEEELALFHVRQAQRTFQSQIGAWVISHEKTGEQMTLAQKYGLPVSKTKHFGKRDGVHEANHLLRGDYTQPHPFKPDEIDPATGLYKLGSPYFFIIVDDDQFQVARDDRGQATFREQIPAQIWTPEKIGEQGMSVMVPFKARQADMCDAWRMYCAEYATPSSTKKSLTEQYKDLIPEEYREVDPMKTGEVITPEKQMEIQLAREIASDKFFKKHGDVTPEDMIASEKAANLAALNDYGDEEDDDY